MKTFFKKTFSFIDSWCFNFLSKRNLILFCFGGGDIEMPEARDLGEDAINYLKEFASPEVQDLLLSRERQYGPQFLANALNNIRTMAEGTEERANPEYTRIQARIKALEAGDEAAKGSISEEELRAKAKELYPVKKAGRNVGRKAKEERERQQALQDDYVQQRLKGVSGQNAAEIAELKAQLANTPERLQGDKGLFKLLEEQSARAGALQRSELKKQRADDVLAIQEFADDIVKAQRDADPASRDLAIAATERAGQETNIGRLGEFLMGTAMDRTRDPRAEERALRQRGLADINAQRERPSFLEYKMAERGLSNIDAQREGPSFFEYELGRSALGNVNAQREGPSAFETALGQSSLDNINAQREAAGLGEQQLQAIGLSEGSLTPTEQEALLGSRGTQFLESTGALTPLEQRRVEQTARQRQESLGRGLDDSGLAGEIAARIAEESGKRDREIALGAGLLGQQAQMRGARMGQGIGALARSEALAAQRRDAQLKRQMFGAQGLTAAEKLGTQRELNQLRRQQLGSQQVGQVEALAAQKRLEQLQRQQFGSQQLTQAERFAAQRREEERQRRAFGAQLLGGSAQLEAQRRAEELERFGIGAGLVNQEEAIQRGRFGQAFGMNRQLAGDVGAAILGRSSQSIPLGGATLGQAQQGASNFMGPQLFDANVGINLGQQERSNQFNLLGAQAQADAARGAGFMGALGQIGAARLMPAPIPCWVAREVYGIDNPKWVQFRNWLFNDAPSWFRNLYIKRGEKFAKFISNKPLLKNIIRSWMDTKIA